jgi:hypothetical protein
VLQEKPSTPNTDGIGKLLLGNLGLWLMPVHNKVNQKNTRKIRPEEILGINQ